MPRPTRERTAANPPTTSSAQWTGEGDDNEYDGNELDFIGRVKRDIARTRLILSSRDDYAEREIPINYRQIVEAAEDLLTLMHARVTKVLSAFESNR